MYSLPELFFRILVLPGPPLPICDLVADRRMLGVEEVLDVIKKKYEKDLESIKKEFFVAAKSHPCRKGIYCYLHECNLPALMAEIRKSTGPMNVLALWLTTVLQIFGMSVSPELFVAGH